MLAWVHDQLLAQGMISPEDEQLMVATDDPDEAVSVVNTCYAPPVRGLARASGERRRRVDGRAERVTLGAAFEGVLGAARAGAEWAWAELYRDAAPSVLAYLRAQKAADPENLVGEVFVQLVRDLDSFTGGERQFRSWLFTIAHNRLLDERRRAARRPAEARRDGVLEWHALARDAEDDALSALTVQHVEQVIRRLSPDQQTVLLLRLFAELTIEEVAAVVGKGPGAVKQLQRRGLVALRRELREGGVTL
jgi:RNA polymerase sigma factor (sigma-70 family)